MPADTLRSDQVTIGGVPTRAVRADGAAGKVRFLFLHGFSDSADCWQRVQRRLAAAGHGSLAVDQPSHGHADPLHPDLPVVEQFLAFAVAAARATDDGRPVVVVGNSLGGAHALLLGQHHPELVHGVAAISPASFDHPGWFRILESERFQSSLALWGTRDRLTLISSRRRFEAEVDDLEFVALPGVGHLAQVEVPGRTTKHLLAFAARVAEPEVLQATA